MKYMNVALKKFVYTDRNSVGNLHLDCALCSLIERNLIGLSLSR